jgi:pyridoxamine 5'-phosphate oxidase family protein
MEHGFTTHSFRYRAPREVRYRSWDLKFKERSMSVFTEAEIEYMRTQTLGRIATVGRDGQPHVTPVTFFFNASEDTIDVGGMFFGGTKKWRDAQQNQKVTLLVDDVLSNPRRARALEVRGKVDLHETGGAEINPRFPNFAPEFFRLRPTRVVSWGLEECGTDARGFNVNARSVQSSTGSG